MNYTIGEREMYFHVFGSALNDLLLIVDEGRWKWDANRRKRMRERQKQMNGSKEGQTCQKWKGIEEV